MRNLDLRRLGPVLAALFVTALVFLSSPAGATSHEALVRTSLPTEKTVLGALKKALGDETSVRLTQTSSGKSEPTEVVVKDEGKSSGLQAVTLGKAQIFVRFNKTYAYLSGNSKGLTTIFELSASDAKLVGTKWIAVKSGTTQYSDIATSSTIGQLQSEILPASSSKVTVSKDSVKGTKADALTWSASESGTKVHVVLDVAASGKSLPLRLTATAGTNTEVTLFAHWNESISVTAPKSTIPISKISS